MVIQFDNFRKEMSGKWRASLFDKKCFRYFGTYAIFVSFVIFSPYIFIDKYLFWGNSGENERTKRRMDK